MPRKNPSTPAPLSTPVPLPATDVQTRIFRKLNDVTRTQSLKNIEQWVDYFLFSEQQEKYHNQLANAEEVKRYYRIKKKLKLGDSPLLMKINHLLFAFGQDAVILHPASSAYFCQKGSPINLLDDGTPYINFHFDNTQLNERLISKYGATVIL